MQPLVNRRLRGPVEEFLRLRDVRVRPLDIAGLGRQLLDLRLDLHRLGDAGDEVLELGRFRAAQVDDFVLGLIQALCPTQAAHDAVDDVLDVGVVPARGAVAVHRDRLIRQELPGELVDRQVRSLARAVDGEEAEAVDRDVVEVVERVRQQLAGPLRRRVGGDGPADRIVLGEGDLVVVAVDGRGGAVDERVDVQLLGDLEHRLRAANVGLLVGHRRLDRRAHPGPRG